MPAAATPDQLADAFAGAATLDAEQNGYLAFLHHVVVDAQPHKRRFDHIAEEWQWEREERSAGAINHLAGFRPDYGGKLSFWHGYHKGSDKTHAIARKLCFLLGWSRRRLNCYVCAGDKGQAALITKAMEGVLQDNPWIADRVEVSSFVGRGASGSTLEVMPMDAWTGQGIFPDYLIAEEITHWLYQEGRDFWNFVLSSVNKRPHCVFEVCTNAGHVGTWQWQERNRVSRSKFWEFFEAPVGDPLPTWMNQEKIDDDSSGMDPGERDRLYRNRWIDPGEERGFLSLADAEACVDPRLVERVRGEPNQRYYAVVDYGTGTVVRNRDRTALCVMHAKPGTDEVEIDRLDCWLDPSDGRIPITIDDRDPHGRSVEGWLEMVYKTFRIQATVLDPYQMEALAQKLERKNRRVVRFEYLSGKKNYRMAKLLQGVVRNRKLRWSAEAGMLPGVEDDTFAKELSRLIKKPTVYGFRFDHESGAHDDRAAAVGMGLVTVVDEIAPTWQQTSAVDRPKVEAAERGAVPTPRMDYVKRWRINGVR
jgi:hypothetical protein